MSRNTAWSKHNSSLPSDRIKSTTKGAPNVAKPKGKAKQQQPDVPPKSTQVRRLEALLAGATTAAGVARDPAGGCFCLARDHALSPYAPLCRACGLILCAVNQPYFCCPHCQNVLLSPAAHEALITRLNTDLAVQIEREIAERERAVEEAQRAAGAFPTLMGAIPIAQPTPAAPPSRQTHKVMSLTGSRRGGVLVSSYTTTPVASRPASRNDSPKEIEVIVNRVPPPPSAPPHALRAPSATRPWENFLDDSVTYQLPARLGDDADGPQSSSRRKRGGKVKAQGKENASTPSSRPDP